jgi:hypothetical protein
VDPPRRGSPEDPARGGFVVWSAEVTEGRRWLQLLPLLMFDETMDADCTDAYDDGSDCDDDDDDDQGQWIRR